VVEIEVPPLRERGPAEIEILARHFAELYSARYARPEPVFDAAALAALRAHSWPGNVRELEHWVESAIVLSLDGKLGEDLLPPSRRLTEGSRTAASSAGVLLPAGLSLEEASRRYVLATVEACDGNKTEAARRLRVGRNTVTRAVRGR
jgi:DNA-binding NtrC family response regulator